MTSTITRDTNPPGHAGHISSGSSGQPRQRTPMKRTANTVASQRPELAIPTWSCRKEWHNVTDSELIQLLTPEGERLTHPQYPLTDDEVDLKGLYRDMVLVRRVDTEAISLQRQGELGLWASLLGQEAAQIGSGRAPSPPGPGLPPPPASRAAW